MPHTLKTEKKILIVRQYGEKEIMSQLINSVPNPTFCKTVGMGQTSASPHCRQGTPSTTLLLLACKGKTISCLPLHGTLNLLPYPVCSAPACAPTDSFTHTWGMGGCQPPLYSPHSNNATLSLSSPVYGTRWRWQRRRIGSRRLAEGKLALTLHYKAAKSFTLSFNPCIYLLVLLSWGARAAPSMLLWAAQKNRQAETLHSRNSKIISPICSLRLSFTAISLQAFYSFS